MTTRSASCASGDNAPNDIAAESKRGKIFSTGSTSSKGIALALVKKEKFTEDKKLFINIRNKKYAANLEKKPFVIGGHK